MLTALERPASLASFSDTRVSMPKSKTADAPGRRANVEGAKSDLDIGVDPANPIPTFTMTKLDIKTLR